MLALAMTELLSRGGERVGLIGGRPYRGRNAARRVAEILMGETGEESLPPAARLSRFSECLLFSDFLEPVAETSERLEEIAAQGVRGHLVEVLDPAEETLPYAGRTEFAASEGQRPGDRRPRRDLARALPGAAEAASQGSRGDDRAARLVLHGAPHRPASGGGRAHPA